MINKIRIDKNEKRMFQRILVKLLIKYKWFAKKGTFRDTTTHDVSGGGMRLHVSEKLNKGQALKTLLYFPNNKKPIRMRSQVTWCRKKRGANLYDVGIRNVRIERADKERFVMLFCNLMIDVLTSAHYSITIPER
ncbi:PilZ domain-containing protein [Candidatus Omnitrophota bacterium]